MSLRQKGRGIQRTWDDDFWLYDFLDGLIDPDGFWYLIRCRREALEALRVGGEGRHQRDTAFFGELPVMAVVHGVRRHHGDPAVTVDVVVPAEEHLAVRSGIFDRAEACRKSGRYFRVLVRRAKARFLSGSQTHPATVVPAGSNRSGRGGNETAEAFDVNGSL